ncbi:MAG: CZB domain-containing protein [Magnetococcales bacterium]|nr:CZB domain-containing protein [Magnetococcales bacterium]
MLHALMKAKVATRIALALAIPVCFLLILGGWSWWVSDTTRDGMLDVRHRRLDAAVLALRMQQNVIQIQQWLTDISATRGQDGLDDGYKQAEENYQAFLSGLSDMARLLRGNALADEILRKLRERVDAFYAMGKIMAAAYIDEGASGGNRYMENFDKESSAMQEVLLPFVEEQKNAVFNHMELAIDRISLLRSGLLGLMGIALLISVAGVWYIARSILRQLGGEPQNIADFLDRLAKGELTARVDNPHGKPEGLMASVLDLQQGLLHTVRMITIQSDTNVAVTRELITVRQNLSGDAANSLTLARAVLEENSALHNDTNGVSCKAIEASLDVETSARAVKKMEENIRAMAMGAANASANMTSVAASAEEMSRNVTMVNQSIAMVDDSVNVVAAAIEEMTASLAGVQNHCQRAARESTQVRQRVTANQGVMQDLESSIQEIQKMVSTIKNIADKTTLLALNAAIEAAGAGEAGVGFAVVANEVKDLAKKTNDATRMIASLIEKTRKNSQRVTESFQQMSDSVGTIDQNNQEINQAVTEQNQAVGEIARSMAMVRSATGNVTRQANEIASSALDVSQLVQEGAKSTAMIASEVEQASSHAAEATHCSSGALFKTEEVRQLSGNVLANAALVQKKTLQLLHLASFANGSAHHTGQLAEVIKESSDTLRQSVAHLKIGNSFVDLTHLKAVHLAWLGTLENVVWGKEVMRAEEVTDHHACALGQWYDQQKDNPLSRLPMFAQLGTTHARIHALAREVIVLLQQGGGIVPEHTSNSLNYTDMTTDQPKETGAQQYQRMRDEALGKVEQFNELRKELFAQLDQLFLPGVDTLEAGAR